MGLKKLSNEKLKLHVWNEFCFEQYNYWLSLYLQQTSLPDRPWKSFVTTSSLTQNRESHSDCECEEHQNVKENKASIPERSASFSSSSTAGNSLNDSAITELVRQTLPNNCSKFPVREQNDETMTTRDNNKCLPGLLIFDTARERKLERSESLNFVDSQAIKMDKDFQKIAKDSLQYLNLEPKCSSQKVGFVTTWVVFWNYYTVLNTFLLQL